MNALQSNIIREITPLSDKDCFYIAERYKTEFTYPIHNHAEFELNFTEKAAGVRRIVGDSAEVISDYDLVLITGKDLEHVWVSASREGDLAETAAKEASSAVKAASEETAAREVFSAVKAASNVAKEVSNAAKEVSNAAKAVSEETAAREASSVVKAVFANRALAADLPAVSPAETGAVND